MSSVIKEYKEYCVMITNGEREINTGVIKDDLKFALYRVQANEGYGYEDVTLYVRDVEVIAEEWEEYDGE